MTMVSLGQAQHFSNVFSKDIVYIFTYFSLDSQHFINFSHFYQGHHPPHPSPPHIWHRPKAPGRSTSPGPLWPTPCGAAAVAPGPSAAPPPAASAAPSTSCGARRSAAGRGPRRRASGAWHPPGKGWKRSSFGIVYILSYCVYVCILYIQIRYMHYIYIYIYQHHIHIRYIHYILDIYTYSIEYLIICKYFLNYSVFRWTLKEIWVMIKKPGIST